MSIKDRNIDWRTERITIDLRLATSMLDCEASQGAGAADVAAHSVAASELTVVKAGADGDEIYHFFPIPWDFDRSQPLRWRPVFSHSSTDADTPTFKFDYMCIADGEEIADITSHETTTISGAVSTTANALEVWDWTKTTSQSYLASGDYGMLVRLETDNLGGASADEIDLFFLELEYTVRATSADGRRHVTDTKVVAQQSLDV